MWNLSRVSAPCALAGGWVFGSLTLKNLEAHRPAQLPCRSSAWFDAPEYWIS
jgi:hypothetical protein